MESWRVTLGPSLENCYLSMSYGWKEHTSRGRLLAGALAMAPRVADAQSIGCEETIKLDDCAHGLLPVRP